VKSPDFSSNGDSAHIDGTLLQSLKTRPRVGLAVGIVMERGGLDEQAAFRYLAKLSLSRRADLLDIADEVVHKTSGPHG